MSTTTTTTIVPYATSLPQTTATALPQYYHYNLSSAAAIVALIFFTSTTVLHAFHLVRTKTWYFTPFLIGGIMESVGYIGRVTNSYKTPYWSRPLYLMETIVILLAPAFLAASMYMLFGRIIRLTDGDSRSFIRQRFLTAIFVCGDALSLIVQAAGGSQSASTDPDIQKKGQNIITAGLFVQIVSFGIFVFCGATFHYKITKRPTAASTTPSIPWQKHLVALYITSALIFGRCIFRVVMFIQGSSGSIASSEVLFYIFDSIFVFAVMIIFNIVHPSEVAALLRGTGPIAWRGQIEQQAIPSHQNEDAICLQSRK